MLTHKTIRTIGTSIVNEELPVVEMFVMCPRISDLAVVPYRQNQSPRLDFRGSDEGPPPRRVTPCG